MIRKKHLGFAAIAEGMTAENGGYRADIPKGWMQGRTAYGGLTSGLALVAAQNAFTDIPPLRSANINFIGPVSGPPTFTPTLLRRGRSVTTVKVVGTVGGTVGDNPVADIVLTFGEGRDSLLSVDKRVDAPPAPGDCKRFTPKIAEPIVPKFFLRFETKLIAGARPLAGADAGYIHAWSRHADPNSRDGVASLLTLSDVLPPAALGMMSKMAPVSSVNFLLNFVTDTPRTHDGWWQVETRLTTAAQGYSSQIMRIYNSDNELVAEGMQAVAVFA